VALKPASGGSGGGGTNGNITVTPLGKQIRAGARFDAVLKVTSVPSGGSPNLTVYFQHSADDGQTWQDYACISTSSTGTTYIPVSTIVAGASSSLAAITDGALTPNTAMQGPVGDRMRIKFSTTAGTSGFFMFQALIHAH
jgi:hypothetical protein